MRKAYSCLAAAPLLAVALAGAAPAAAQAQGMSDGWTFDVALYGWLASWRYLDYSFKSDSKFTDLSLNGPLIGVAFNF